MATIYTMRGRDPDCATITYRTWRVSGSPDFSGTYYSGSRCGATPLSDITISSVYLDPAGGGGVSESVISPSQITTNQNNYEPSGWGTATHVRLSTDAIRSITGFASVSSPTTRYVINVGSYNINILNSSTSSSVGNRVTVPGGADLVLEPNDVVTLWKDPTSNTWVVL
jgi:hypothetical protein